MKRYLSSRTVFLALATLVSPVMAQPASAPAEGKGFRGFVCDDRGTPVPNAKVRVNFQPVQVDTQGRFFLPQDKLKFERTALVTVEATFENPERNPPYRWEVSFARVFDYASGDENVTIRPRVPGALAGRVLTVDGQPIAGAMISAHMSVGLLNCHGTHPVGEAIQTDAEGRFRVPRLYANHDYLLRLEARGYERKWTEWVHVRSGEPVGVDFRLRNAPGTVAGRVLDALGKPVAKARVVMGHLCIPDAIVETDAAGRFRIDSLLPEQAVDLWVNGKTVKAKAGNENLVVVVP
jgi:protocatechuate 3,4-dioxygenase beta subunit